jgi:hypothetical protein
MPWRCMGECSYTSNILNLSTGWRWAVSFTPRPVKPVKWAPDTDCIGDWLVPKAGQKAVEKKKISLPMQGIEPWSWKKDVEEEEFGKN